jgi:hypothetical protein
MSISNESVYRFLLCLRCDQRPGEFGWLFCPSDVRTPPAWTGYGFRWTVPVLVETGAFTSELVLTNASESQKKLDFLLWLRESKPKATAPISPLTESAGHKLILPNLVQYLRAGESLGLATRHELRGCTVLQPFLWIR